MLGTVAGVRQVAADGHLAHFSLVFSLFSLVFHSFFIVFHRFSSFFPRVSDEVDPPALLRQHMGGIQHLVRQPIARLL